MDNIQGRNENAKMEFGDFTQLADAYAKYRPGYSPMILDAFLGLIGKPINNITGADVGAGTGIWSRALASRGVKVTAVEPNTAMSEHGKTQNGSLPITWHAGSAENTGLAPNSCDFVCMASSFHWPDFDKAIAEFNRILKPHGLFMALWNTRHYEINPLLVDIENKVHEIIPNLKRVSSGRSEFCNGLLGRLAKTEIFEDVIYVEGNHIEYQSQERYIGLWESVNDIRVQAGEEKFAMFLDYIRNKTHGIETIEAEYTTRAWIGRRK